jgi:HAD superfamily hydrolase (TIGR01509 family)
MIPFSVFLPLHVSSGIALIFDMDGVIIDSNPIHTVAWKRYLARFDRDIPDLEQRMYGRRNDEIVREFFGPSLTAAEVTRHGAEKERLYRELMTLEVKDRLVPGVVEFIRSAAGIPLALATNAEPANVSFVLEAAGIADNFHAVIDGHQVEFAKPHPEIYLKAAELLLTPPENCIVFEDSYAGTEAARRAGARVVGVTTSHAAFPDADFAIRDFQDLELRPWLSQQRPRS